jgi:hypothetical protein
MKILSVVQNGEEQKDGGEFSSPRAESQQNPVKCYPKIAVERATPNRKNGYIEEVKKRNTSQDPNTYCLTTEDVLFLKENFSKDKVLPSLMQMAKNAAGAITEEAKAIAHNDPPVSIEEQNRRMDICRACEWFTPNIKELPEEKRKQERCVKCGCFMNLKKKLRSQHCPMKKW